MTIGVLIGIIVFLPSTARAYTYYCARPNKVSLFWGSKHPGSTIDDLYYDDGNCYGVYGSYYPEFLWMVYMVIYFPMPSSSNWDEVTLVLDIAGYTGIGGVTVIVNYEDSTSDGFSFSSSGYYEWTLDSNHKVKSISMTLVQFWFNFDIYTDMVYILYQNW